MGARRFPVMYYYAAIEPFDSRNGDRWIGFTRWLGRTDLKRIVTLDSTICPTVVHPQSADDWQYIAREEFMLDFFTDLEFVRRRAASRRSSMLVAVARDPSAEDVENFPHADFELAGFDVVDTQFTGSVLLSQRFPDVARPSRLSAESGLMRSREWAFRIRDSLRRNHPNRPDAQCFVWAVWRHIGNGSPA